MFKKDVFVGGIRIKAKEGMLFMGVQIVDQNIWENSGLSRDQHLYPGPNKLDDTVKQ